jgi:hypothetical protein
VVLSLSPTVAPPSASLLSESAPRVPDTTTAFLVRQVLLSSARSSDETAQLELAKLDSYMVFLCSEKNMSTVFPAGFFRFDWCRATQRACGPKVPTTHKRSSIENL